MTKGKKWNGGKVRGYKAGSTTKGHSGSERPGQGYLGPHLAEDTVGMSHYGKKGKTPKPKANPFAASTKRKTAARKRMK